MGDNMDKKIYTITLANGAVLNGLELNGNNYVSNIEIKEDIFDGTISPIKISDGKTEKILDNMQLIRIANWENKWWILILEKEKTKKIDQIQADIVYLSMMMDINL